MDRLDPRFKESSSPTTQDGGPQLDEEPTWPSRLRPIGSKYEAFVLLQPGRRLPDDLLGTAVQFSDTMYLIEADYSRLRTLATDPAVVYIEAPRPMGEDLDQSVPATKADLLWNRPTQPLSGAGVVIGIIDTDGLDWKLKDFQFRRPQGSPLASRVISIWDQGLAPQGGEAPPAGYQDGVEYDRAAINADLNGGPAIRHRVITGSHATHVAGIAAGNGDSHADSLTLHTGPVTVGVAYEAEIVYVEVPKIPGTALTNSAMVVKAIKYVFEKAGDAACVINVSMGSNGGAHDSESIVERIIDHMLEARSRALVKSAGNEGAWNCHAATTLTQADPVRTLYWQVGRAGRPDRTPNEMEIWYSGRDNLRIRVTAPDRTQSSEITPGPQSQQSQFQLYGEQLSVSTQRFHELNGAGYIHLLLEPIPPRGDLQVGVWEIAITAGDPGHIKDGRIDAWIERDRRDASYNNADQSIFVTNYVSNERTISPPGTIRRGLTVANYDLRNSTAAGSSSWGPTRDDRQKPDLSAPGEAVWSSGARGVVRGNPDTRLEKSGTSMSAPHVTGICALLFQHNKDLTSAQIGAALVAAASQVRSFDRQLGFGLIDANEAIGLLS